MAKKQTSTALAAPPDIDVQATDDDILQLTNDGNAIKTFLAGLAGWFVTQRSWEKKAENRLDVAKTLPAPNDQASDERVQKFITGTAALEKEFEGHSTIKGLFWKLHKRAVAIDKRVGDPLAESKRLATNLHNAWVEKERKRVAEENARLQRAAEAKARADREVELLRLENERLQTEVDAPELSERETLFVDAFVKGSTPEMAASAAGYKNPLQTSGKLLITPKIEQAIELKRQTLAIEQQKAAVAQRPLDIEPIEEVTANVGHAASDVTRWSGEVVDEQALIAAVIAGKHGIPWDVLECNRVKLNEYARSLQLGLNRWPGCRANKATGVR